MTDLRALLAPIRELAQGQRVIVMLAEPDTYDTRPLDAMTRLLAAIEAVLELADNWQARGEHDMAYSKTIPDEDIAMSLLTSGADMVEDARHIRNALVAALGSDTTNQEGTQ